MEVPALELTTREVVEGMRGAAIGAAITEKFRAFLDRCDLVKFAKLRPGAEESREVMGWARELVGVTSGGGAGGGGGERGCGEWGVRWAEGWTERWPMVPAPRGERPPHDLPFRGPALPAPARDRAAAGVVVRGARTEEPGIADASGCGGAGAGGSGRGAVAAARAGGVAGAGAGLPRGRVRAAADGGDGRERGHGGDRHRAGARHLQLDAGRGPGAEPDRGRQGGCGGLRGRAAQ